MTVNYRITNAGPSPMASTYIVTYFYVTTSSSAGINYLGMGNVTSALSVNGSVTGTATFKLHELTDPGIQNVVAETDYYSVVTELNEINNEGTRSITIQDVDLTPPAAPLGLSGIPGIDNVSLSWLPNAETDMASYEVFISTDSIPANAVLTQSINKTVTQYDFINLFENSVYFFWVKAVDVNSNKSVFSKHLKVKTYEDTNNVFPPRTPLNLKVTAGELSINLKWDQITEKDLAGYVLYRNTSNSALSALMIKKIDKANPEITDEGLTADKTYYYWLKSEDIFGKLSGFSAVATAKALPKTPKFIFNWKTTFAGAKKESGPEPTSIKTNAKGEVFVLGTFSDSAYFDNGLKGIALNNSATFTIFLAKYSSAGKLLWLKTNGVSGPISTMAIDDSSNVYFAGRYSAEFKGVNGDITGGNSEMYVTKFDSSGNCIWINGITRRPTVGGYGTPSGVTLDKNYDLIVTGSFNQSLDFDATVNETIISANESDIFLAKYNRNGKLLWAEAIGGAKIQTGNAVAADKDNNIYITGSHEGYPSDFDPSSGTYNLVSKSRDMYVAKYTSNGALVWAFTVGGSDPNITPPNPTLGNSILIDLDNNVCLTGYFSASPDFDPSSATNSLSGYSNGFTDAFVAKYDKNGKYLWAKSIASDRIDRGTSIAADSLNNLYVTGSFANTVSFFTTPSQSIVSRGGIDIFLLKYDPSGKLLIAASAGSKYAYGERGQCVHVDKSNAVYLGGIFSDTVDFDLTSNAFPVIARGLLDGFLVRYSQDPVSVITGNEKYSITRNEIYYENPVREKLHFFNLNGKAEFQITDLSGNVILNDEADVHDIDVSQLRTGLYIVRLKNQDDVHYLKIIKE